MVPWLVHFGLLNYQAATTTPHRKGLLVAVWSIVHGFSYLALSGELGNPARGGGGKDVILKSLLPLTLDISRRHSWVVVPDE